MKVLKVFGLIILILVALFLIIPLFMGTKYQVSKKVLVDAEKSVVYPYLMDFSRFGEWSPWADIDPNTEVELIGNMGAVGSSYKWKGNDDVGEGTMTIARANDDTIFIDLNFVEPFEAYSPTYYALKENGNHTEVTWYMEGEMAYPMNILYLFMDMEEAIGNDFEKGLSQLKDNFN